MVRETKKNFSFSLRTNLCNLPQIDLKIIHHFRMTLSPLLKTLVLPPHFTLAKTLRFKTTLPL